MTEDHGRARPLLEVKDLSIAFSFVAGGPRVPAVEGMNLSVREHEFVALIGPSGCGKTTTLNAMAGLISPDAGQVLLKGAPVTGVSAQVGYISQADNLLPWRTVLENVALGLELRRVPKKRRQETARELISRMGLEGFEKSYPHELSGGMQKRVSIARVMAIDPAVLFMDEPFGPLDMFTKEKLQDDLLALWEGSGKTIVYVTHDLTEAISLADRVVLVSARPGRVRAEYPIDLPRPRRVMDVKFSPRVVDLEKAIWEKLRHELARAEEGRHG